MEVDQKKKIEEENLTKVLEYDRQVKIIYIHVEYSYGKETLLFAINF